MESLDAFLNFVSSFTLGAIFLAMIRNSIPLVFASIGGVFSERSGVIQIGLEAFLLVGALFGAIGAHYFQSGIHGLVCGAFAGLFLSWIFSFSVLIAKADAIVAGTALNLLVMGVNPYITKLFFGSTGATPSLPIESRLTWQPYLLLILLTSLAVYIFKFTRFGLWISFAGESPKALRSSGISPILVRFLSLCACGIVTGIGGSTLSIFLASSYSPNMSAGRGFIALATVIMGRWRPGAAIASAFLFTFIESAQVFIQSSNSGGNFQLPTQLIQAIPYLLTILTLVFWARKSQSPKALGESDS